MKKATVLLAAAACTGALLIPAAAQAEPGYCSASGDVCYGITGSGSSVKLRLTTAAQYFSTYRVCVTPPSGKRTCVKAKVKKLKSGIYGSALKWSSNFPNAGHGTYKVKWYASGGGLGPSLSFKR
jgi:hypothetical protein